MALNHCFRAALNSCRMCEIYLPLASTKMNYSFKPIKRPDIEKLKLPRAAAGEVPLATSLAHRIKLSGPLTVADYMKEVLTNPFAGYYMNKDMFGVSGDFVTSPEVSGIFGDVIGIWLMGEWEKLAMPKPLQIVELGPGRGTLLSDILNITKQLKLNSSNLSLHLVEVSPTLQRIQGDRLCASYSEKDNQPHYAEGETLSGCKVFWYKNLKSVPKNFSLYVAHEFFDALPVHKFKKTDEGWREVLIDVDPASSPEDPNFRYVLSREETMASKVYVQAVLNGSTRDQLEVSPQALSNVKELANRVEENGGIALIIDYGHNGTKTDTFRAYKNHKQTDPLKDVGSSDLTADVDFSQLARAAAEAKVVGPITQQQFLETPFAQVRLQLILDNATDEEKVSLKSGYEMLSSPEKMGEVFKFMALFPTISKEHYKRHPVLGFPES